MRNSAELNRGENTINNSFTCMIMIYKFSPVHSIGENVCLNIVPIQKKCEIREKQDILVIIWYYLCRVDKCFIQFYVSLLAEQSHSSFLKKNLKKVS